MLYLIGGTPRCGKSTVAKMLSKKIGGSYLQTDYLASAIGSKMTEGESKDLFGERITNMANRRNNEVRFSMFSNSEQIEMYRKKAIWNWEGIKNIVNYALADEEVYVLEGFHLWPDVIAEDLRFWGEKVTYIVLYKSDVKEIEGGIKAHKHPNDRATKTTINDATYGKIASFIYDFGQHMKDSATMNGLETFDMSQGDFFENLKKVEASLLKN